MKFRFRNWLAVLALAIMFVPGAAFGQDDPRALQPARDAGIFSGVTTKCWQQGTCNFCDGLVVFINVANFILALLAIVAVIFFVYGAGHLALSSGNENYVHKGKEAIKASIIGTLIVLGAWQIMAIVVLVMANQNEGLFTSTQQGTAGGAGAESNWVRNWYTVAQRCGTVQPGNTPTPSTQTPASGSDTGGSGGSSGTLPAPAPSAE
jgi:hypothetical protein